MNFRESWVGSLREKGPLARISHITVRNSHGAPTLVGANPEEFRPMGGATNLKSGEKVQARRHKQTSSVTF